MTKIRDPKIHWFAFDCHCFDHHMRDSFTNAPDLVTCGICKRHVEFILPRLRSAVVLTTASTVTAAPVDLAANNVDAGAAADEPGPLGVQCNNVGNSKKRDSPRRIYGER